MEPSDAALAILISYVAAYRRPSANKKALAVHATNLIPVAGPTFKALGAVKATHLSAINVMRTGACAGKKGLPSPKFAALLAKIKKEMQPNLRAFYMGRGVNAVQQRLWKAAIAMLAPDSATVDRKDALLDKKLTTLPDNVVKLAMVPEVKGSQSAFVGEVQNLVKTWTGRKNDTRLGMDEAKDIKEQDPDRYKRYLALRRSINETWQAWIRSAARAAGGPIKVSDALKGLKDAGVTHHPLAPLARLRIGEDCRLYSPTGKRLVTPIPPEGSRIEWNDKYDPRADDTYLFQFKVPNGKGSGMTTVYTVDCLQKRRGGRFQKVLESIPKVDSWRSRWLKDLFSTDRTKSAYGALAEAMYANAARPGATGNSKDDKPTFGMTTLNVAHVSLANGGVILRYPGKDGVQQTHAILPNTKEASRLIAVIARLAKGKKSTDFLWTDGRGNRINAGMLNKYLRSCGMSVTSHKFRHIRGTKLMQELLASAKIPKTANKIQVAKIVKDLAVKVGELLGHVSGTKTTAATSIKNYIVPDVIAKFFADRGLDPPDWLPKARAAGASDEEEDDEE